jgi:hypothetical protein
MRISRNNCFFRKVFPTCLNAFATTCSPYPRLIFSSACLEGNIMKLILAGTLAFGMLAVSTVAAVAGTAWTSQKTALNARSGPGTNYHVQRSFKRCTKVHVVKYSHGWAKVSYAGKHYWVSSKFLRGKPCATKHHNSHATTHHKYHTHKHKHGHKHRHTHKHRVNVGHH